MTGATIGDARTRARRKVARLLIGLAIGLVAVVAIGAGGALTWRAVLQHRNAEAFAIRDPRGIAEARFVRLGGVDQWVTIRGRDRLNPVLLMVGGDGAGIGATMSPLTRTFLPWERDFTVVTWDTRGAGKTFQRAGRTLDEGATIGRIAADGIELSEQLRAQLHKRKIVLLGASFGSTVAVRMAEARPDLYAAYVAAYQVAGSRTERERFFYQRLENLVRGKGDPAELAALRYTGPDPLRDPKAAPGIYKVAARYRPPNPTDQTQQVLTHPDWSLADAMAIKAGYAASDRRLLTAWDATDWETLGSRLSIPVVVIQGADNDIAPLAMTEAWLARVPAPLKVVAPIAGAGGHAMETHNAAFLQQLDRLVRPLAVAAQ
jgi:pimeloyl-ACP methyl ester carboxylesterase